MAKKLLLLAFFLLVIGFTLTANTGSQTSTKTQLVPSSSPTVTQVPKNANTLGTLTETAVVKRVVDGDTIELADGRKLRYIGIDTPETVDPRRPVGCFGKQASDKNKELVEGQNVQLEKDVSEMDKFGRLLRYVYVGDVFVNDHLVRQGYAHVATYPPDVKYQKQFLEAQIEARENNRGLWVVCK